MKMADISIGGEYAYARSRRDHKHRVKVLQKSLPEGHWQGAPKSMVEIEFLDELKGYGWGSMEKGGIKKVLGRELWTTWEDEKKLAVERAEARARKEAYDQAAKETSDAYAALFAELGFGGWQEGLRIVRATPDTPKLTIEGEAAQKLFDLLAKKTYRLDVTAIGDDEPQYRTVGGYTNDPNGAAIY